MGLQGDPPDGLSGMSRRTPLETYRSGGIPDNDERMLVNTTIPTFNRARCIEGDWILDRT